jgi:DNA-binding transcriptional ArsR family regulator
MAQRRRARKLPRLKLAMQSEGDYQSCASRLKALADPDRLRIVNCLLRGEKNVSELGQELGMGMVKVSHHLGVLRSANVVRSQKEGKFVIYALHPEIAGANHSMVGMKTLDLGCCRLDLAQSKTSR